MLIHLLSLWSRLSLFARLLLATLFCLLAMLLGLAYQTAHYTATNVLIDMANEHRQNLDMLAFAVVPALVADAASHDADSARLKSVLENFQQSTTMTHVGFRDTSDAVIFSRDTPILLTAPLWFSRWCGLEDIKANRAVVIEGQYFGVITLSISPVNAINRAWGHCLDYVVILLLTFGLMLLSVWWFLRQGLLPLNALVSASEALGQGDLSARLDVRGSPELQTVIEGFNRMASCIEMEHQETISLSQRLQLATSSAQLGVWDWNVRDNQMVWNSRMFELYGITTDTFSNNIDAWMSGLHPGDKEAAIAECQAALNGEKAFDTIFRVQHSDGTIKFLRANGLVIHGADGLVDPLVKTIISWV